MNIVISGTVGVGKSTISKKLEEHLSRERKDTFLMEEIQEDNPILDLYYKNREKWSFIIQLDFVLDRFKKALINSGKKSFNIFDRHFLDDYIFASMPLIRDDIIDFNWKAYKTLNHQISKLLEGKSKVDYFFLLKADFDVVLKRIENRGRDSEKKVDKDYWYALYQQYYNNDDIQEYLLKSVDNLIIIDANTNDIDEIINSIIDHIK